ncbi:MAG: 50S ribosomal protein L24 [bacterium]|nr:50S ribosomal protein L24 [bacterium]
MQKVVLTTRLKIKKGDKVKVTVGKDKGREGTVEKVFPKDQKVLVAGINIFKKHARAQKGGKKGGIIDVVKPLPLSNIAPICPKCGKITRFGYNMTPERTRICRKCKEVI